MSKHFLSGITYDAFDDTGPGFIIVDAGAKIVAASPLDGLDLAGGSWDVTVSGTIFSTHRAIVLADAGAFVSNVKINAGADIFGTQIGIAASHPTNISNAGHISAKDALAGIFEVGDGDYSIRNLKGGVIEGLTPIEAVGLGTHTISNAGTIAAYANQSAILGGDGSERITNFGKIVGIASTGGGTDLGDGSDIFTNFKKVHGHIKNGTVTGTIHLGGGDDIFNGGKHAEKVQDAAGTDTYNLGRGSDVFRAVYTSSTSSEDGADIVNGGPGVDIYDARGLAASGFVSVNLDSVEHFAIGVHSVKLSNSGLVGIDTVTGFEQVVTGDGADILFGSNGADSLAAGPGQDNIVGLGGADLLDGGADDDFFIFTSLKDSGPTPSTRDTIGELEDPGVAGGDIIDLQSINDAFGGSLHFFGNDVGFDGSDGAIIAVKSVAKDQTIVKLDVNGDKVADFSIALLGLHDLAAIDFML
jgi:hypothetical protein